MLSLIKVSCQLKEYHPNSTKKTVKRYKQIIQKLIKRPSNNIWKVAQPHSSEDKIKL